MMIVCQCCRPFVISFLHFEDDEKDEWVGSVDDQQLREEEKEGESEEEERGGREEEEEGEGEKKIEEEEESENEEEEEEEGRENEEVEGKSEEEEEGGREDEEVEGESEEEEEEDDWQAKDANLSSSDTDDDGPYFESQDNIVSRFREPTNSLVTPHVHFPKCFTLHLSSTIS